MRRLLLSAVARQVDAGPRSRSRIARLSIRLTTLGAALLLGISGVAGASGPSEQGISPVMGPFVTTDPATQPSDEGGQSYDLPTRPSSGPGIAHLVFCEVEAFTPTWNYGDQQVVATATNHCSANVEVIRLQVCVQKRIFGTSTWGSPVCSQVYFLTNTSTISRTFRLYCTPGATYSYRTYAVASATHDGVTQGYTDASPSWVNVGSGCLG